MNSKKSSYIINILGGRPTTFAQGLNVDPGEKKANKSQKHPTKWKKPSTKDYTSIWSTYMNLKRRQN